MCCRYCHGGGDDDNPFGTVPQAEFDPKLGGLVCRQCGVERDWWCAVHDLSHTRYSNGTICCELCAEAVIHLLGSRKQRYYQRLLTALPATKAWLTEICQDLPEDPPERALRSIVHWALWQRVSVLEAIEKIIAANNVRAALL